MKIEGEVTIGDRVYYYWQGHIEKNAIFYVNEMSPMHIVAKFKVKKWKTLS